MDDDKHIFEFYIKYNRFPEDSNKNQYEKFKDYLLEEDIENKKDSKNKVKPKLENEIVYSTIKDSIDEMHSYKVFADFINNMPKDISIEKDIPHKKNIHIKKKINKSKIDLDDRLDLHGLTEVQALRKLNIFIHSSMSSGYAQVLIIHGKGYHSNNGRAVLKDMVECYVKTDGKEYILKMIEAPLALGGSGAKILWLK